jgi:hypothetical protein
LNFLNWGKGSKMSYPNFKRFQLGVCQQTAGAEFMLMPRISVLPMVNLKSNSFSCALRQYFPKADGKDSEGFVSIRLSTRDNASMGIGIQNDWLTHSFGLVQNMNSGTIKPYISVGFSIELN